MKDIRQRLLAAALATTCGTVLAAEPGPYAMLALGRTHYDADCSFLFSCRGGHATGFKLGAGYAFGVSAVEVSAIDWGNAPIGLATPDHVHLRSLGLGGAWHINFGASVQGVLRAGVAQVQQRRNNVSFSHSEGTLGLGLVVALSPTLLLELSHDAVTSTGGDSSIGSVLGQTTMLGLRVRF